MVCLNQRVTVPQAGTVAVERTQTNPRQYTMVQTTSTAVLSTPRTRLVESVHRVHTAQKVLTDPGNAHQASSVAPTPSIRLQATVMPGISVMGVPFWQILSSVPWDTTAQRELQLRSHVHQAPMLVSYTAIVRENCTNIL